MTTIDTDLKTANRTCQLPTAHTQVQTDCHDVGFIAMARYLIGTISYEF